MKRREGEEKEKRRVGGRKKVGREEHRNGKGEERKNGKGREVTIPIVESQCIE